MLYLHHWLLPLVSLGVWWAMLTAMLIVWAAEGRPVYKFMSRGQSIVYISDIGAEGLKPLFIACTSVQAAFMILALTAERYLRHAGRLYPNWRGTEKILSCASIITALAGQAGIILLTIFDTRRYPHVHLSMLALFLSGLGVAAFFQAAEYFLLDRNYRDLRRLQWSYITKTAWLIVALSLTITFVVLGRHRENRNKAAGVEWTLAFFYGVFLIILAFDLYPAGRTRKGEHLGKKVPLSNYPQY